MRYGISELAIIPIRSLPDDKSEMINQILFGEHFKILEIKKKWSYIRLAHDDYKGWICNKQWLEIDEENYNKLNKETPTITTDIIDIIKRERTQTIVIGSTLPSYKSNHATIGDRMYKFNGLTTTGFVKKERLIQNACMYLKTPYLWGGRSPFGIDCSGFAQIVYRLHAINLPRDAHQQAKKGTTIPSIKLSQEGDLVFFNNPEGNITHVGIILKKNHIIHASGEVRIDNIDEKGILNKETGKYTHKLKLIKRLLV